MRFRNKVYVLEGMDAAGKGSQVRMLYTKTGGEIVSFPRYETNPGNLVKTYLTRIGQRDSTDLDMVMHDSAVYMLDRADWHLNHDYNHNQPLLFDRYFTSNILFQTLDLTDDDKKKYIERLLELEVKGLMLPEPDIVFLLLVDPRVGAMNIKNRGRETDFFEAEEKQRKIYDNGLWLADYLGWKPIQTDNGKGEMREPEDIHIEIFSHIPEDHYRFFGN